MISATYCTMLSANPKRLAVGATEELAFELGLRTSSSACGDRVPRVSVVFLPLGVRSDLLAEIRFLGLLLGQDCFVREGFATAVRRL